MAEEEKEWKGKNAGEAWLDLFIRGVIIAPINFSLPQFLIIPNIPLTVYTLSQIISVQLLPLSAFPKLETAATWLLWIFIGLMFAGAGWKQMLLMLAIGGVAMGFLSSLGVFAVADSEIAASYNDLVQNSKVKNQTASGVSNVWLMLSNPRLWYEQNYGYKNDTLAQGDQVSPFALEITKAKVLEVSAPPGGTVTLDIQVKNQGKRNALLKRIDAGVGDANLGLYSRYTKEDATDEDNKDKGYLYFESTDTKQAHYEFCDNPVFEGTSADTPAPFKFSVPEQFSSSASAKDANNKAQSSSVARDFTSGAGSGRTFEPGVIDEYFVTVTSPDCYGTQKVNASLTYGYDVTGTYNLELVNPDYFTELAKYNRLKFHTEDSKSTEGPLKLTIRSVPEQQPVRLGENSEITVFYGLSNVGPGAAVIKKPEDIFLEDIDTAMALTTECNFENKGCLSKEGICVKKEACPASETPCAYLKNDVSSSPNAQDATKNFYTAFAYDTKASFSEMVSGGADFTEKKTFPGIDCAFGRPTGITIGGETKEFTKKICLTFSPDNPSNLVLLKCKFKYDTSKGQFDTTKTLFMKMHVNYDYITSRTAQYETIAMPGSHSCVTKRALDGFPNKTAMDLYLKEVFKDVKFAGESPFIKSWSSDGLTVGTDVNGDAACLCPTGGCAAEAKT